MFRNKNIQNVRLVGEGNSLSATRVRMFFKLFGFLTIVSIVVLICGIVDEVIDFTWFKSWFLLLSGSLGTSIFLALTILFNFIMRLDVKVSKKKQRRLLFKLEKYEYKYTSKAHKNQTTHSNKVLKKDYKAKYKINKK